MQAASGAAVCLRGAVGTTGFLLNPSTIYSRVQTQLEGPRCPLGLSGHEDLHNTLEANSS